MTGLEVEDLAESALEGNSGTHNVTGLVPTCKHNIIGVTDAEWLGVELLALKMEVCGNALGDRMRRKQSPNNLVYILTPRERAGRTDKLIKGLRGV